MIQLENKVQKREAHEMTRKFNLGASEERVEDEVQMHSFRQTNHGAFRQRKTKPPRVQIASELSITSRCSRRRTLQSKRVEELGTPKWALCM